MNELTEKNERNQPRAVDKQDGLFGIALKFFSAAAAQDYAYARDYLQWTIHNELEEVDVSVDGVISRRIKRSYITDAPGNIFAERNNELV